MGEKKKWVLFALKTSLVFIITRGWLRLAIRRMLRDEKQATETEIERSEAEEKMVMAALHTVKAALHEHTFHVRKHYNTPYMHILLLGPLQA